MAKSFEESNNTLFESKMPLTDVSEIVFSLIENKRSGLLRAGIREFKHTDDYDGPTRNGMLLKIASQEDADKYQKAFNEFFDKIKEKL